MDFDKNFRKLANYDKMIVNQGLSNFPDIKVLKENMQILKNKLNEKAS